MDAPKYQLIYADPPWQYRDKAKSGKRGAGFKYPTMKTEDICRLPVWDLVDDRSCLLAMWWVPTMVEEALAVMKAWGFRLVTMKGFTWHKTNKNAGTSAMGMGHLTRANTEDCLFAVRGRMPLRRNASIIQHFDAPRLEHSAKPPVVREKLDLLVGDVPRIELFCRGAVEGWHTWGNQAETNNIEFQHGRAVIPFNWKDPNSPFHPSKNVTLPYRPAEGGISDAFALLEQKTMLDWCDREPVDGQPRTCPRCGQVTRLEYHTCAISK
ncbi:S-adenosylmethionine-binding protein [Salmonella enterica subsp. enterica serovar Typhimurium]|nr:S-adenosylmethionine-binding protein [Salmonella enterica subsp. enterica serovar Typhimurium]